MGRGRTSLYSHPRKGRQHLREPLAGSPAWHPQPTPGRGGSTCDIPPTALLPQGLWALCKGMPRKRSRVHIDNKHSAPFRGDLLPSHTAAAGRSAMEQDLPPCSRCRALRDTGAMTAAWLRWGTVPTCHPLCSTSSLHLASAPFAVSSLLLQQQQHLGHARSSWPEEALAQGFRAGHGWLQRAHEVGWDGATEWKWSLCAAQAEYLVGRATGEVQHEGLKSGCDDYKPASFRSESI